jgi:ornithine cyclodeaminase/alanine dehydrogenase-like protein (mu-crystallin family)
MSESLKSSRRGFLRTTAAAAVAAPYVVPGSALGQDGKPAASERISLGIIGCGGMGRGNLANCAAQPDIVVTAVCDVQAKRRDAVVGQHKATAKGHVDYRELLARKDVDAVIIATPPHWP